MKIIWDSLDEIRDFIQLVDITKLAQSEKNWGGLGYIIDNGERSDLVAIKAGASEVIAEQDIIIFSPKAKELSWLFRNLYEFSCSGKLSSKVLLDAFWVACKIYFMQHPVIESKSLLLFVIRFIADCSKEENQSK